MRSLQVIAPALILLIAAIDNLCFGAGSEDIPLPMVHRLVQRMQSIASPGWSVSYDDKIKTIDITRYAMTSISSNIPNPSPGEDDTKVDHFSFWLSVAPFVSKARYAKERRENQQPEESIAAAFNWLVVSPTVGGIQRPDGPVVMPSEPYSNNPADQKNIVEYERLKKLLHELPDGYYEDISLHGDDSFPKRPFGPSPSDEVVRQECVELFRKLAAVPTKY